MDPELQARLDTILSQIQAANTKLDQLLDSPPEGGEDTTEAKAWTVSVNAARAELTNLEGQFENLKERAERQKKVSSMRASVTILDPSEGRITSRDAGGPMGLVTKEKPWALPAEARRYRVQNFRGERDGDSAEKRAHQFGCWAKSLLGQHVPQFKYLLDQEDVKRFAAVHSSIDSYGTAFFLPPEISNDLIDLRLQYGVIRNLFRNEPMMSASKRVPRITSGMSAYWGGESVAATESNAQFAEIELRAKKLTALTRLSDEIVADASIALGDFLASDVARAFAYAEDNAALNGDGTSTYGGVLGIAYLLQNISGTTDSAGLVTGAGNAWSELTLANFESVIGKLPAIASSDRVAWLVSRPFYSTVMRPLEAAVYYTTPSEIQPIGGTIHRFMGYRVVFSELMPKTEANSQVCAIFGDFALGAVFGDRQQEDIQFSRDATISSTNLFVSGQIALKATERLDINVYGCGDTSNAGPIVGLQTASS